MWRVTPPFSVTGCAPLPDAGPFFEEVFTAGPWHVYAVHGAGLAPYRDVFELSPFLARLDCCAVRATPNIALRLTDSVILLGPDGLLATGAPASGGLWANTTANRREVIISPSTANLP